MGFRPHKTLITLLSPLLLGAASPTPIPYEIPLNDSGIVRVECTFSVGSAVQVGHGAYVTAAHVVDAGSCTANGSPVEITYINKDSDIATFKAAPAPHVFEIDCSGFVRGETYLGRGFAFGGNEPWAEPLVASGWTYRGKQTFSGNVFPGMSGGPVLSYEGKVVGIVNTRNPSSSLALKDSVVCQGD